MWDFHGICGLVDEVETNRKRVAITSRRVRHLTQSGQTVGREWNKAGEAKRTARQRLHTSEQALAELVERTGGQA
jgi:alanine dehydrogenase